MPDTLINSLKAQILARIETERAIGEGYLGDYLIDEET